MEPGAGLGELEELLDFPTQPVGPCDELARENLGGHVGHVEVPASFFKVVYGHNTEALFDMASSLVQVPSNIAAEGALHVENGPLQALQRRPQPLPFDFPSPPAVSPQVPDDDKVAVRR